MTTTQQPLALKLAEAVKTHEHHPQYKFYGMVSDELRRLHSRVVELEEELEQSKASSHQYFLERNSAREAVKRYQQELEAVGAGGVESLSKKGNEA